MTSKQKRKKGRKTKSAGRFGVRYGRKVRAAVAAIEERTHAAHTCPKCEQPAVKRMGTGIWTCTRCGYTFTGGTYVPFTSVGTSAQRTVKRILERGTELGAEPRKAAEPKSAAAGPGGE
jgi:large subunit ribosomal protein L37Ae